MKDHKGDNKGYRQLKRCWYGESCLADRPRTTDEVTFGFYSPCGGTSGEMTMEWLVLSGRPVPQLKVFNDAWHTLCEFRGLIEKLADYDDQDITTEKFCEVLDSEGFVDLTEEIQSNK